MKPLVYRAHPMWFGRYTMLVNIGFLALFVAATAWVIASIPEQTWFFVVVLGLAFFLNVLGAFKVAYELAIRPGELAWRCPFRSGRVSCQAIRSVKNVMGGWPQVLVQIRTTEGPNIYVYARSAFRGFADALRDENPAIAVDERSYRSWRRMRWLPWRQSR